MTDDLAQVRVVLPDGDDGAIAVTRVYSADLALIGEAAAGDTISVPPGRDYLASAVAMTGGQIGLPMRFDVSAGAGHIDIPLGARSSAAPLNVISRSARQRFKAARPVDPGDEAVPMAVAAVIAGEPTLGIDADVGVAAAAPSAPKFQLVETTLSVGASWTADGRAAAIGQGQLVPAAGLSLAGLAGPQASEPRQGRNWCLVFDGPNQSTRYAIVPFDVQNEVRCPPQLHWSAAWTAQFFLPVFEFAESRANALQTSLRYDRSPQAQPIASKSIAELAETAMAQKTSSPLAAALGGLIMLQETPDRLRDIEPWTANLFNWFPWLPDALPLRVELLAKLGRHEEARSLLLQLPQRGPPWTRRGLRVLVDRMSFYDTTEEESERENHHRDTLWCQSLLAMTHPACVFCVFEVSA